MTPRGDELRLELRIRNQRLWQFIHVERGYASVAAFCREQHVSQSIVCGLLNRTQSPFTKGGRLNFCAGRLCDLSGYSQDELFPLDLYGELIPRRLQTTAPAERFLSLAAAKPLLMLDGEREAEDEVFARERREAVNRVLNTLPPKDAAFIRGRFGLKSGEAATVRQMSTRMHRSQERARQVEARILRKLRHPSQSKRLRPFIESDAAYLEPQAPPPPLPSAPPAPEPTPYVAPEPVDLPKHRYKRWTKEEEQAYLAREAARVAARDAKRAALDARREELAAAAERKQRQTVPWEELTLWTREDEPPPYPRPLYHVTSTLSRLVMCWVKNAEEEAQLPPDEWFLFPYQVGVSTYGYWFKQEIADRLHGADERAQPLASASR